MRTCTTVLSIVALSLTLPLSRATAQALAPARVDSTAPRTVADTSTAPRGPRADLARVGISRLNAPVRPGAVPAPIAAPSKADGRTLALVGGIAFLGGLIIGSDAGTAIAIGGLIIGAYGVYIWMR